jgi:hypothetical protein
MIRGGCVLQVQVRATHPSFALSMVRFKHRMRHFAL